MVDVEGNEKLVNLADYIRQTCEDTRTYYSFKDFFAAPLVFLTSFVYPHGYQIIIYFSEVCFEEDLMIRTFYSAQRLINDIVFVEVVYFIIVLVLICCCCCNPCVYIDDYPTPDDFRR